MKNKTLILYGIKNCDSVRKARNWLQQNKIDYQFHDFKTDGLSNTKLKNWVEKTGWETLLNKRGTTFRQLSDTEKQSLNKNNAIKLMLKQPTMVKRPVLEMPNGILVGYDIKNYAQLLKLSESA